MWPNFPPIIFPSENFIWSDKVRSRGDYTSAFVSFTKQLIFKNVRLKVCIVFDSFFLRSLFAVSFAPNFPKTLLRYPEKTSLPPFLFGTFSGRGQALKKQPWKNKANHRRLGYNALKRFDFCKLHFFHLSKLPQIITVLKSLQRWTLPLKGNCPVILGVGGSFCFLEGSSRRNSEPPKKKQTATAGSFPVPQRCLKQTELAKFSGLGMERKKMTPLPGRIPAMCRGMVRCCLEVTHPLGTAVRCYTKVRVDGFKQAPSCSIPDFF